MSPGRWIDATGGHPAVMVTLRVLDAQLTDGWLTAGCPGDDPNIRVSAPLQMSPAGAERLAAELLTVAALPNRLARASSGSRRSRRRVQRA